jgi:hypothetical protein
MLGSLKLSEFVEPIPAAANIAASKAVIPKVSKFFM